MRIVFVATALTVYGIETQEPYHLILDSCRKLQQHLPFTVLKPSTSCSSLDSLLVVATALTVYGIETFMTNIVFSNICTYFVATALTVYGIETALSKLACLNFSLRVATALTVYGIETASSCNSYILSFR